MLTLFDLCEKINMPQEATEQIMEAYKRIDLEKAEESVNKLYIKAAWKEGLEELKSFFGEDKNGFHMLALMLMAGTKTFENYKEKGIPEQVFFDTFACFSRFVREYKVSFGEYGFDRAFWTPRQISMMEFRIGELEFEMDFMDGQNAVSVHIPSDAKLSKEIQKECYKNAKLFFQNFYPEYEFEHFMCNSWMLCPELKEILPPESRILGFQSDYDIKKTDPEAKDYMEWIFKNKNVPLEELPEDTSLQRNLKRYLMDGGKIGTALGYLKMLK